MNKLPWKHAAKLYRNKYRVTKRKSERQRKALARLYNSDELRDELRRGCILRQSETIIEQEKYIAELEHLIETGTERD